MALPQQVPPQVDSVQPQQRAWATWQVHREQSWVQAPQPVYREQQVAGARDASWAQA